MLWLLHVTTRKRQALLLLLLMLLLVNSILRSTHAHLSLGIVDLRLLWWLTNGRRGSIVRRGRRFWFRVPRELSNTELGKLLLPSLYRWC